MKSKKGAPPCGNAALRAVPGAAFGGRSAAESGFTLFSQEVSTSRRPGLWPACRRHYRTPGRSARSSRCPTPANLDVDRGEKHAPGLDEFLGRCSADPA
jgi:hypothetical protein